MHRFHLDHGFACDRSHEKGTDAHIIYVVCGMSQSYCQLLAPKCTGKMGNIRLIGNGCRCHQRLLIYIDFHRKVMGKLGMTKQWRY